jgi:hypothetical protein
MSLPPGALWLVARKMGPRCRSLSRALLDAYGPLDGRLVLRGRGAPAQLEQLLLSGSAQRLRHITSLHLEGVSVVVAGDWSPLIALICRVLPLLGSLSLPVRPASTRLELLAPLAPTLTRLQISFMPHTPALGESLQQLTNLRSLTLRGSGCRNNAEAVLGLQQALGGLPHLAHLRWFDKTSGMHWRSCRAWPPTCPS